MVFSSVTYLNAIDLSKITHLQCILWKEMLFSNVIDPDIISDVKVWFVSDIKSEY